MTAESTIEASSSPADFDGIMIRRQMTMVLAWSRVEPARVGELIVVPTLDESPGVVIGRGEMTARREPGRASFDRGQISATSLLTGGFRDPSISRQQLRMRSHTSGVFVENIGRPRLISEGSEVDTVRLVPGDVIAVGRQALLCCVARELPREPGVSAPHMMARFDRPFGAPDGFGMVGESVAMWRLREQLASYAALRAPVLIAGPPGSGKTLAAQVLHALSRLAGELHHVDALELAGKAPPERGALLIEHIGNLDPHGSATLRTLLDNVDTSTDGLRLMATVNNMEALDPALVARFPLVLRVPGLEERRRDLPLLIRHIIKKLSIQDPTRASRYTGEGDEAIPRAELTETLLRHTYRDHVRELNNLVTMAWSTSRSAPFGLTAEVRERLGGGRVTRRAEGSLTAEVVQACLERHNGVQEKVWKELGLKNRFALRRLIAKHGLAVKRGRRT